MRETMGKKRALLGPEKRILRWLPVIAELLEKPLTAYPQEAIREHLAEAFDVTGVSWNWREADGSFGLEVTPVS